MIKRQYMIVFTILLFFIFTLPTLGETKLTDIEGHWGQEVIEKLIELGAISGYPDGTFKPSNPMSVGEFTKVLVTALGSDPGNADKGHWAMNYIKVAENKGIILSKEFDSYNKHITRGEIARMVVRAMNESYPSNINEYAGQIADFNQIPSNLQDYVLKAYVEGIITGYPNGTFKHDSGATRAEASAMVMRLLDETERQVPELKIEELEDNTKKDNNNKQENGKVNKIKHMTEFPKKPVAEFATKNIPTMFRSDVKVENAYVATKADFPIILGKDSITGKDVGIEDIKIEPTSERSNVLFVKKLDGDLTPVTIGFITKGDDFFRQRMPFSFIDDNYISIDNENGYKFYWIADQRDRLHGIDNNYNKLKLSNIEYIYFYDDMNSKDMLIIPNPF